MIGPALMLILWVGAGEGAEPTPPSLTLAAVGDVLLDGPLHRQALEHDEGFGAVWAEVAPLLREADIAYANLEGPLGDGPPRGFPRFNHPARLAADLAAAGVDVVSTANNHSLDQGAAGLERTLEVLDAAGLAHAGTRRRGEETGWVAVVRRQGFKIAFVACTFAANGRPDPGRQVLRCYQHRRRLLTLVRSLAARDDVDAVIVTPHFGLERLVAPRAKEQRLARELINAGAIAVLGAHPHKLHRVERLKGPGGREGLVAYSLGNFVSGQRALAKRTGAIVRLTLERREGEVVLGDVDHVPLVTDRAAGRTTVRVAPEGSAEAKHAARVLAALPRATR